MRWDQSPYTNKILDQRNGPYWLLLDENRKKVARIYEDHGRTEGKTICLAKIGICDMYQSFVFAQVLLVLQAAQRWQAQ